jgi:hypothetical protein
MALYADATTNTEYKPLLTPGSFVHPHKNIMNRSFVLAVQVSYIFTTAASLWMGSGFSTHTHIESKELHNRLRRPESIQTVLSFREEFFSPKSTNFTRHGGLQRLPV